MLLITPTTTLTTTLPLALLPLPSGATGAVLYTASFGEIVIALLLTALLALTVVQMWRQR